MPLCILWYIKFQYKIILKLKSNADNIYVFLKQIILQFSVQKEITLLCNQDGLQLIQQQLL